MMNMNHGNKTDQMTGHMNMHSQMQMAFRFGSKAVILFEEWDVDSPKGMAWSCVVVFLMAVIYEGFKVFREVLREKYTKTQHVERSNGHISGKSVYDTSINQPRNRLCNWHHFLQSFLHIIQVAVSYFLMLIAMTFNGWLFISVCVGAGFGYFLFSWRVNKGFDVNEHCH